MFWEPNEMFREDCRLDFMKASLNLTIFDTMWLFLSLTLHLQCFWLKETKGRKALVTTEGC